MTRGAAKPPSQRQLRVGEQIRHVLAQLLLEGGTHIDLLADRDITVTEVRVSPDLKAATAFVTPLGGGDMAGALDDLRRAAPALRHELARQLNLRFTPRLSFQADRSFDEAQRIERLLRSERVRRDVATDDPEDGRQDGRGSDQGSGPGSGESDGQAS
jgi:ribosome-binding factor A